VSCEQCGIEPACLHNGCTGARVAVQWSPFCSQLCAALWALEQTDAHTWCTMCNDWCTADDCLFVRGEYTRPSCTVLQSVS
jgi:hypothetical protein